MAARIIDGLGAAANETLGPMLVADMFFLQDRGFWNGFYFFSLFCSCAMAPIIGGYIASSPLGWRVCCQQVSESTAPANTDISGSSGCAV